MMGMHFFGLPFGGLFWIFFLVIGFVVISAMRKGGMGRRREDRKDRAKTRGNTVPHNLTENQIFSLADKHGGTLTLSEIVLYTGVSLKEADEFMKKITDGIHIQMNVTEQGTIIYEFPELTGRRRLND